MLARLISPLLLRPAPLSSAAAAAAAADADTAAAADAAAAEMRIRALCTIWGQHNMRSGGRNCMIAMVVDWRPVIRGVSFCFLPRLE